MLLNILLSGDIRNSLISLLLFIPAVCLCLSAHEAAHGLAAWLLGDPTAKEEGRITLFPVAHLDPAGFLCMLLIGFGWAKPVPVSPDRFRHPKRWKLNMALVALAGPVCNLLMAAVFMAIGVQILRGQIGYILYLFCYYASIMSVSLGVFNLIPIYPLDGSRLLTACLPYKTLEFLRRNQTIFLLALIAALWFGLFSTVTGTVYNWIAVGVDALLF